MQVHCQERPLTRRRHNTEKTQAWKMLSHPSRESRRNPSPRDHPMITDERFSRQPAVCIRTLSHVASAPNLVPCTDLVRLDLPRPRPARRPTHTTSQCAVKP